MAHKKTHIPPLFIIFIGSCLTLIGLLFFEYRSLVYYQQRLRALKNEYRTYVRDVRSMLADYQQTKTRLQQLEKALEGTEYANDALDILTSSTVFDEHVKVFSSDSDDSGCQDSFVMINRDLEYLKQQSQEYVKRQNLELLFLQIPEDVWRDYTETALSKKTPPKKPQPPRKRVMRSASSMLGKKTSEDIFSWPIKRSSFWLSSLFGHRKKADGSKGFHYGIDMAALKGTPVYAASSGVVVEARNAHRGYGNTIVIKHNNKYKTRYAHLNAIHVRVGQRVQRGAHIGDVGDTGFVRKSGKDASHLHFELYVFGERVNPLYYLA